MGCNASNSSIATAPTGNIAAAMTSNTHLPNGDIPQTTTGNLSDPVLVVKENFWFV